MRLSFYEVISIFLKILKKEVAPENFISTLTYAIAKGLYNGSKFLGTAPKPSSTTCCSALSSDSEQQQRISSSIQKSNKGRDR